MRAWNVLGGIISHSVTDTGNDTNYQERLVTLLVILRIRRSAALRLQAIDCESTYEALVNVLNMQAYQNDLTPELLLPCVTT